MYEIANYTDINGDGTAVLLEALAKHRVERLVVASSMSIYGEGMYRTRRGAFMRRARTHGRATARARLGTARA